MTTTMMLMLTQLEAHRASNIIDGSSAASLLVLCAPGQRQVSAAVTHTDL